MINKMKVILLLYKIQVLLGKNLLTYSCKVCSVKLILLDVNDDSNPKKLRIS